MANFSGGSAYAMSRDVGEGLILVNANTFKKYTMAEMKQLAFELDRVLKEVRADQPAQDDIQAIQKRGRKLTRVNQALMILRGAMGSRK